MLSILTWFLPFPELLINTFYNTFPHKHPTKTAMDYDKCSYKWEFSFCGTMNPMRTRNCEKASCKKRCRPEKWLRHMQAEMNRPVKKVHFD
jgi:hypothetical protein